MIYGHAEYAQRVAVEKTADGGRISGGIGLQVSGMGEKLEKKKQKNENKKITAKVPYLIGGSKRQNDIIEHAWHKTEDIDFIKTLLAENGTMELNRLSKTVGANGYRDQGLCQLNRKYHLAFIQSKDFKNAEKQVSYCWEVYSKAMSQGRIKTTFYGYNVREHVDHLIGWKEKLVAKK